MSSITKIINAGLCTGCGSCVAASKSCLKMSWNEDGFLVPQQTDNEKPSDNLIKYCPFNPAPDPNIKDEGVIAKHCLTSTTKEDSHIGRYINTYAGYSKDYRKTSSSGGLATYIFHRLLEQGVVDKLFVVKELDGAYAYCIHEKGEDIKSISKTRYLPVSMEGIFDLINNTDEKIGVAGVACFIKAIRIKQYYDPELKIRIPFTIGIICGGLKSKYYSDFLSSASGIQDKYTHQEYRIKNSKKPALDYKYGAYDEKGEFKTVRMQSLGDMWGTGLFKARACDYCTDVFSELSDISLGDAWINPYNTEGDGNSIIITRSKIAEELIISGIDSKELVLDKIGKEKVINSQSGAINHRQKAIGYRAKIDRAHLIPSFRSELVEELGILSKLTQFQRGRLRIKSLIVWKKTQNAELFFKRLGLQLKLLKLVTKLKNKKRFSWLDHVFKKNSSIKTKK